MCKVGHVNLQPTELSLPLLRRKQSKLSYSFWNIQTDYLPT